MRQLHDHRYISHTHLGLRLACRRRRRIPSGGFGPRNSRTLRLLSRVPHFLPSDRDETGIHGPFIADRIVASDFVPLKESALEEYLADLLYSTEWDSPASAEQFAAVLNQLRKPFAQGMRCFFLRFDESRSDLHHDWGFVLTVFREFLFLGRRPGVIARFVIGYD